MYKNGSKFGTRIEPNGAKIHQNCSLLGPRPKWGAGNLSGNVLEDILVNFDFSDVGGHPIGIALVSSFLKVCGADPLVVFYYLQPFLSAVCFILLFRMLITVLPDKFAFFI